MIAVTLIAGVLASQAGTADLRAQEKLYEERVKAAPTAELWQRLGLTRHLQNHYDAAIPAFREAIARDPKLWTSHLFLGICLYRTNQFEQALASLEQANKIAPPGHVGRDDLDYWLAATKIALNKPLEGLESLESLLARKPDHADALELAIRTYTDLSSKLWNDVAERNFETPEGYEVYGRTLEDEGNRAKAMEAYRTSLALNRTRPGPRLAMGRILLKDGKPSEALEMLKEEFALSTDPEVSLLAGLAAAQTGDRASALRWLQQAQQWRSTKADATSALAALQP